MSDIQVSPRVPAAVMQLDITGGLHSGVHLPLTDGDYAIGSSGGADIVLWDEGVAPQHVVICVEGHEIRVEAIGDDVQVNDNDVAVGHGCRVRLPATLTIGTASLTLSRVGGGPSLIERLPFLEKITEHPITASASVVGAALATALVFQIKGHAATEQKPPSLAMLNNPVVAAPLPVKSINATADVDKAAGELSQKLKVAGIDTVKLTTEGTQIVATGKLPESQASQWVAAQRWFDRTYSAKLVLTSSVFVGQAATPPALRLQAVWYGERPYIIADNGARYFEGAVLDNGWILHQISENGVTLRKDEEKLVLSY
jgi:hypothetical protein